MNKFYKTSYSRQNNFNNYLYSAQDKRQILESKEGRFNFSKKQDRDIKEDKKKQSKLQNVIEQKIQINPDLLFTNKPQSKQNQFGDKRCTSKTGMFHETATEGFNLNQERPQSKQQSRVKAWNKPNNAEKRNSHKMEQRPQTSKGQRKIKYTQDTEDQHGKNIQEHEKKQETIPISGNKKSFQHPISAVSKKSNQTKLSFETSIDPQFLALFAS